MINMKNVLSNLHMIKDTVVNIELTKETSNET